MANNRFIITISILLPLAFLATTTTAHELATWDDEPGPATPTATVVVEGKVYCKSCNFPGSSSLTGAKPNWGANNEPIWAAKVGVICKNHKRRISFYKSYKTDHDGYFYAELKGFKMSHSLLDHPLHACRVKLVSSPHETCNILSNLNNGMKGSPLRFENKVVYGRNSETVIYAAGPFAFRSNYCDLKSTP